MPRIVAFTSGERAGLDATAPCALAMAASRRDRVARRSTARRRAGRYGGRRCLAAVAADPSRHVCVCGDVRRLVLRGADGDCCLLA